MQREIQESDRRKAAERSIGNGMNTTAAIYLRKSTEDDGQSVAQQERDLRTKADHAATLTRISMADQLDEDEDQAVA